MTDPIDRHVEAEHLWEDLQDGAEDAESDYQADLAKDGPLSEMVRATGLWAAASEDAVAKLRQVYDQVRLGKEEDSSP